MYIYIIPHLFNQVHKRAVDARVLTQRRRLSQQCAPNGRRQFEGQTRARAQCYADQRAEQLELPCACGRRRLLNKEKG